MQRYGHTDLTVMELRKKTRLQRMDLELKSPGQCLLSVGV